MTKLMQRFALTPAVIAAAMVLAAVGLAGCGPQPTYQVVQTPAARVGTVESVQEIVEPTQPSGAGLVLGALAGGGLGSLIGSGSGRTVATVVGAVGGGYVGNQVEKSRTNVVYQIGVKYDDGTWATIRQATPTGLRVGDRVRVTDNSGIELLR
ncbi:MAG TPA: glycine zipper 2TM domain-containing protein [Casimicrobiaceae bacterium]|jgi:outer membrane lipoprotein SlyB|nr:glycine zipper 2TM domain-containing protein [Casimicrobiaceae bacterium]